MRRQRAYNRIRWGLFLFVVGVSGCGGGDDNDDPSNRAPIADAGNNATVVEFSTVVLDGSGTADPNKSDEVSYSWTQLSGPLEITLTNSETSQATFTAPDVNLGSPQQYTFQLEVSDGSLVSTDTIVITVSEPVILSGTAEYEFVPPNNNCQGLAFPSTFPKPIRGATLQVINASDHNDIIAETVLNDVGNYSIVVPSQSEVFIRVRAELKKTSIQGEANWDVEVRDNTSSTHLALSSRPLYVLDTDSFSTGISNRVQDILAETGWTGYGYTEVRAAAPFSILDTIYDGMQLVISADSEAAFPPLDVYWSVNNSPANREGSFEEYVSRGNIGLSFYNSELNALFLLGKDEEDTEEFDVNVVAHEWGHYFEDNFSRSDSNGGPHSIGNLLDKRLAFSEGWGTAIAAMATGNTQYCDTGDPYIEPGEPISGFGFNVENSSPGFGTQGWFNEITIARYLYDLWDTNTDGTDNDSLGNNAFSPIYSVMSSQQKSTEALTSIFSFSAELKNNFPDYSPFINSLLEEASISTNSDSFGNNENNDADGEPLVLTNQDVLPVYHELVPDGGTINVCSNSQFDNSRNGNKLSEFQYIRFEINIADNYRVSVQNSNPWDEPLPGYDCEVAFETDPDDPEVHRYSDPDFILFQNGKVITEGSACTPNNDSATAQLQEGVYVISLTEFRFSDSQTVRDYPERACFDVDLTRQ